MDNYPRQKLSELISQYGRKVLDDPRRLEGLLHDYCGAFKKEVNVLIAALKERVPFEILKMKDSLPQEVQLARLISRLVDDLALSEDAAGWAVETWALALKVIDKPRLIVKRPKPLILDSQTNLVLTLAPGVTLELVHVPAGEFLMGSDKKKDPFADDFETPQHTVYLEEYLIGKYPITNAQYLAFVRAAGDLPPYPSLIWNGDWKKPNVVPLDKEQCPVERVFWDVAIAFCDWASQVSGRKVCLPSEAEWEKAARGTDGRIWPWGNQPPDETRCNYNDNVEHTTLVEQYSPEGDSPYGCADMAGNVWEWTRSLVARYPYKAKGGREDLHPPGWRTFWYLRADSQEFGSLGGAFYRMIRGGQYSNGQSGIRCARREYQRPDNYNGFRVAVSP